MVLIKRAAIIFGLAAAAIGLSIATDNRTRPFDTYKVNGTISRLDPEQHEAALEYKQPQTGRLLNKSLTVPADCEIRLNRRPANLADLRIGDHALVTVNCVKATKELRVLTVQVDRPLPNAVDPSARQGTIRSR
jgi:hypothetical protein